MLERGKVQGGVPERTSISMVRRTDELDRRIIVGPWFGIHCMRSKRGENDGPFAALELLETFIGVGASVRMGREMRSFRLPILEPHHAMLPVCDVVSEVDIRHCWTEVERIEEEPKGVQGTRDASDDRFIDEDEDGGGDSGFGIGARFAFQRDEPRVIGWGGFDISGGGEIAAFVVELRKGEDGARMLLLLLLMMIGRQTGGAVIGGIVMQDGVAQMLLQACRPEGLVRVQMDHRRILQDEGRHRR